MRTTTLLLATILITGCAGHYPAHISGQVVWTGPYGAKKKCELKFAGPYDQSVYCLCPDTIEVGDRFTLEFKKP